MIPLLNQGAVGLKQAADEAVRFGIVLSKDMTDSAEAFNDNLTRMHKIGDGLIIQLTSQMLPALEELSRRLVATAGDGDVMKAAADIIMKTLSFLSIEIAEVVIRISSLGAEWVAFKNLMNAVGWDEIKKAWADWGDTSERTEQRIRDLRQSYTDFWTVVSENGTSVWAKEITSIQNMTNELGRLMQTWGKVAAPILQSGDAAEKAARRSTIFSMRRPSRAPTWKRSCRPSARPKARMKG
jgi:hypothetical protein